MKTSSLIMETLERSGENKTEAVGRGGGRSNERGPSRGMGWALMEGQGHGGGQSGYLLFKWLQTQRVKLPRRTRKRKVTEVKGGLLRGLSQVRWKGNRQKEHYRGWIKKSEFVQKVKEGHTPFLSTKSTEYRKKKRQNKQQHAFHLNNIYILSNI